MYLLLSIVLISCQGAKDAFKTKKRSSSNQEVFKMSMLFKKIFFNLVFNLSLFSILIIGIQNSSKNERVNFIFRETINLPISFIIGVSFITGSITGSILSLNFISKDKLSN